MKDNAKTVRTIFTVLMCISLFIFLLGLVLSIKFIFIDVIHKESTYGIIKDISNNSTLVEYKANNTTYEKRFSVYNSTYFIGKRIKIYYDKISPRKSLIASMRYMILILPGIAFIFLGVSGVGLIYVYMKYYRV